MAVVDESGAGGDVRLTGMLAEFRTALQEEIVAARRQAANNAVPLVNGRRIAQVGSAFQYVFEIENALHLPGDAPGDLYVPERAPLEVTVISVDGMAITLSIPVDIGGFVATARLQSNLAHLMRRLIERIEKLDGVPNPAGDRVRGARPVSGNAVPIGSIELGPAAFSPNTEQLCAIASSLGRDTTFIWGPPGTGKSRTIGSIGEQLYRRGRCVLLVSHTNNAVDQALCHVGDSLGPAEHEQGKVLRVGDPKDPRLMERPELLASTHVARRSEELTERRDALDSELQAASIEVRELSRQIDICEWVGEAQEDLTAMSTDLVALAELERELSKAEEEGRQLQDRSVYWAAALMAATEAQRQMRLSSEYEATIPQIRDRLATASARRHQANDRFEEAQALLAETTSVGWLVRRWRRLPSPDEQRATVESADTARALCDAELERVNRSLLEAEKAQRELLNKVEAFRREYSGEPEKVVRQSEDYKTRLESLQAQVKNLTRRSLAKRRDLEELLAARLSAVREWGLTSDARGTLETMLQALHEVYKRAVEEVAAYNLDELRNEQRLLNGRIRDIEIELAEIDEALKRVEELVIADAVVVATTLTRAYLRDAIQSRRFDTVILDEASMAPIPALWVAASLADANAVVVGDFKQLPPIVLSEHKLAQKWLGRDIFDEAELSRPPDPLPSFFIALRRQYRMHPFVSAIPNVLVYKNRLEDDPTTLDDRPLDDWYDRTWGHDTPVLLVDTGPVGAWVTSVARGARSSRLNFLSATICVDIARQLLRDDRSAMRIGGDRRVLIVCPYRPHAQLVELLLRDEDLTDEVGAGTAHNFQGSEADIVILDLVNDEPHWRVAMFMPDRDRDTTRLLNVALTRARRRLIVVGDFDYIAAQSKRAFIGSKLIPFLEEKRYPRVSALDIVPCGLAARAAKAQSAVLGGDVEPSADRIVVTQEHFYSILRGDISRSQARIVIYSAFITTDRLAQLETPLRAAVERAIRTYVVTKARSDRRRNEVSRYRVLEQTLTEWGIVVVHKRGMHEKLVICDDNVLWSGSLNPLSFRDTQEVMERRSSKAVVSDYVRTLRLEDLVGEYDSGRPSCPYCGAEVVASEGRDQPFFWRCVEDDCYTRSVGQPALDGGMIVCSACGAVVEYGEWGGKPAWRCKSNRRHHQKVARTHIRLPKMRDIIPKRELRKLDKKFGIKPVAPRRQSPDTQGRLFPSD